MPPPPEVAGVRRLPGVAGVPQHQGVAAVRRLPEVEAERRLREVVAVRGCRRSGIRQRRRLPLPRLLPPRPEPCGDRISVPPVRPVTGRLERLRFPMEPGAVGRRRAGPWRLHERPSSPRRPAGAPREPGRAEPWPRPSLLHDRASSARAWTWRLGQAGPALQIQVHRWRDWPDLPPPQRVRPQTRAGSRRPLHPSCRARSAPRGGRHAYEPSSPRAGASSPRAPASCGPCDSRQIQGLRERGATPTGLRVGGRLMPEGRARPLGAAAAGRCQAALEPFPDVDPARSLAYLRVAAPTKTLKQGEAPLWRSRRVQ